MGTFPDYGPLLYFLKCDFYFCHLIYWVTDFFDIVLLLLIIKYLHLVSSKYLAIVPVCPYIHICFPFSNHIISQLHIAYKSTFTINEKDFFISSTEYIISDCMLENLHDEYPDH